MQKDDEYKIIRKNDFKILSTVYAQDEKKARVKYLESLGRTSDEELKKSYSEFCCMKAPKPHNTMYSSDTADNGGIAGLFILLFMIALLAMFIDWQFLQ